MNDLHTVGVSGQEDTPTDKSVRSFTFKRSGIFKGLHDRLMVAMYRNFAMIGVLRELL
jgi:hypothetical protein